MAKPDNFKWDNLYTLVLVANALYFVVMYLIMNNYS